MSLRLHRKRLFTYVRKLLVSILVVFLFLTDFAIVPLPVLFDTSGVEQARAATGDFSIFRENASTEQPLTDGTPLAVTWDTEVSESSNIQINASTTEFDLADGGKYMVLYNMQMQEGASGGSARRNFETYLTLDGTELAYGRAGGYLRESEGLQEGYSSGGTIVDATAGQDLGVYIARDGGTSAAEIRDATNGISILKIPDNWDYLRLRNNATSSNLNNTTFTAFDWGIEDEEDTDSFGFTPTSSDITLKGDADQKFIVMVNARLFADHTANTRLNYEMRLTTNDGGGAVEVPGTRVSTYIRGNQNGGLYYNTLSYVGLISKTTASDETLNVEIRRESTGTLDVFALPNESGITIAAVPSTAEVIRLVDNDGTQSPDTTRADMGWNRQDEINTSAFSHSTTSNNHNITIQKAGDYLFFASAYSTTTTSGAERQPFRMDWEKNGSLTNYGGFGAFNRANTAFSGGAAGGLILNGLSVSDTVSLSHIDETSDSPVDIDFARGLSAVQGIALNDNFYGLDVLVSATGTHSTETDITTADFYSGGGFVIKEQTGSRNVTSIRITESGSVDAANGLNDVELWYDLDESAADDYDCSSESYDGDETQFGGTNEFSGANGTVSFSGSVNITTTKSMCVYVVYTVDASASDSETVEISIDDPSTEVVLSGSPSVGPSTAVQPTGSTTLRNAELTQTHYRWLNDDGIEGSATAIEAEDTPTIGFANGTTRRVRFQVDAAGSTSSVATTFQLDYATKTASCAAVVNWLDVGATGGAWDMSDSLFLLDGSNATNIATTSGGLTDPSNATFLTVNSGLRDTNSTTSPLIATSTQFVEFEFAIEPTVTAPQGNTYCFRLSDNGTALRNYDNYAEGTISADIDVSASSSQVASLDSDTTNQYVGGTFVIERAGGTRTLTDITITATGTVDATKLLNPTLHYDIDTTAPQDCTGESYAGTDTSISGTAFSGPKGTSTFSSINENLNNTSTFCGYIVFDVSSTTVNGETIIIEIKDPSTDVVVTSSSVGPSSVVSPTGSTTIAGPILTQTHYHWRNDNGDETDTGATSASGGAEDTTITGIPQESPRRLRLQVSNEGSVTSAASQYRLEYKSKVSVCSEAGTWTNVGDTGGAFDMVLSTHIADGNTTDIDNAANGAMTEENNDFVGTGALRETEATSSAITLTSTQYTELEYSIQATTDSGFDTTYCFRVTNAGNPLLAYDQYAELTTREKQDYFVQRGLEYISGTSSTYVAGIDYIAPSATSAAFVRLTGSQYTGSGERGVGNTQLAQNVTAYIEGTPDLTSSFTIARPPGATGETRVDWEIVEYVGLSGADNEMVVRDVGTITYGSGATVATGSVASSVSDDSDVVVYITGMLNPGTAGSDWQSGQSTAFWHATNSEPVFTRSSTSVQASISYAVVEYTGLNWAVQRVEHAYAASGSTETESITAVNSLSRTYVHAQKRFGGIPNGLDEFGHRVYLNSLGSVAFVLNSGTNAPTEHDAVAWVIENTQTGSGAMSVYRDLFSANDPGPDDSRIQLFTMTGGSVNNITNASVFITNDSTGNGTAYPRPMLGATVSSTNQVEIFESDAGQTQAMAVAMVQWPVAETAIRQNYYRLYVDNDLLDPDDPWPVGASDLGENEALTGANDPIGESERIRIRMSLAINNATLPLESESFKLQFGLRDTTCTAISAWTDVGDIDSSARWRGYDSSLTDGAELATSTPAPGTLNLSVSDVAGTFEEENNSAVNPYLVDVGEDVEYDWLIEHNGATQLSDYCFRMVKSDGTELDGYFNYPTIRTTGYTPVIANWRWYDDATSTTPTNPMAAENVAPTDVEINNEFKLRVTATEVEGAPGENVKFALQYSEYPDFSDGGTFLVPTSTCGVTSTWCYAAGAGIDNATITTAVLSDADSCVATVGDGCGTHNEAATTTSTHFQPSLSSMEFEFTLQHAAARVNAVYYFRLYDIVNDVAISASSSYPSLVTQGPQLIFTATGLPSGTTTEGITTDVATASTSITFGDLPFGTDYKAAYRLSVDTNATEGYQVFMVTDRDLENAYGDTLPANTGSNAVPSAWSTGCTGLPACFAYHAGDDTLSGGSARFAPDDSYAALSSTTLEEIAYSSIPVNESHDIVFRALATESQPAGEYSTDLTFIVVPVH